MAMSEQQRWDPSLPGFITAVLHTLLVMGALATLVGMLCFPILRWGVLSGSLLAIALYVIAMLAGRQLLLTRRYTAVMVLLLGQQAVLWIGMAILLALLRVNPVGFVLGVSILPSAIVVTLIWYLLHRRRMPS